MENDLFEGQAPADLMYSEGSGTEGDLYIIYDVDDLQNMSADLTAHYALGSDIDASETSGWNDGDRFVPLGTFEDRFSGSFDGRNHTINDLYVNRPGESNVGLFGRVDIGGTISNVGLISLERSKR